MDLTTAPVSYFCKTCHRRCLTVLVLNMFPVLNMPVFLKYEKALLCQGSEYSKILNYAYSSNTSVFWIYLSWNIRNVMSVFCIYLSRNIRKFRYARVLNIFRYARVLNILFLKYKKSSFSWKLKKFVLRKHKELFQSRFF